MKKMVFNIFAITVLANMIFCATMASIGRIDGYSKDPTYGYSAENPIRVGIGSPKEGLKAERAFLEALRGPKGERIKYRRVGSCCPLRGGGLLDKYEVTYEGLEQPKILFLNMYDSGKQLVPVGFTSRKNDLQNADRSGS